MTNLRLLIRNLWHHRWINIAVLLSVAVATAALTGALIVGDSVRGSLQQLVEQRLGAIDLLLLNNRFFDPELVTAIQNDRDLSDSALQAACILPSITIEVQNEGRRSRGVFLSAWGSAIGAPGDESEIGAEEIVINAALARELDVEVGDSLVIRLPEINEVPADSPLGQKDGRVQSRAGLRIKEILPMANWGLMSLSRNQRTVRNAFVALPTIQRALGVDNRVNAIVVTQPDLGQHSELCSKLNGALTSDPPKLKLSDYGIRVETASGEYGNEQSAWSDSQFTSDRMIWQPEAQRAVDEAIRELAAEPNHVFTYLANSIRKSGATTTEIPYSTVAALDANQLAQFELASGLDLGELGDDDIVLNQWAAESLQVEVGDAITLAYFDPETTHGKAIERARDFTLRGVLALTEPAEPFRRKRPAQYDDPPTRANDPALTPTVEGITDQDSIDDWDPPFPFEQSRVRPEDDEYWDSYRTTPKAYVSIAAGRSMWASRFGESTSIRVIGSEPSLEALESAAARQLAKRSASLGFTFRAVKQEAVAAASGTTPFEALFIGFNFFLIAAALMLIAILIRLGVQLRSRDLGLLQATGWSPKTITRNLVGESLIVAIVGAIVGSGLGICSASGILAALRTWWVRAITTPFVQLHVLPRAILLGIAISVLLAMVVAWWTLRKMAQLPPTRLLRGEVDDASDKVTGKTWPVKIAWLAMLLALVLAVVAVRMSGMAQAGAFFGSGSLLLIGLLLLVRYQWFARRRRDRQSLTTFSALAAQGAARSPGRSALTVGLVASAVFLIVAIAAFRLEPTEAGTGGFDLIAQSDRPIFDDLNDLDIRNRTLPALGESTEIVALRVKPGDDASCRNLFRVSQPQLLGVTPEFVARFDESASFTWAGAMKREDGKKPGNPWRLLDDLERGVDEPIPVVLDKNTAMYSLHLKGSVGEEFTIDYDPPIRFRTVGLVFNTILQGSLLVAERDLERLFPEVAGYQMWLVDSKSASAKRDEVKSQLEKRYGDEGLDAQSTHGLLDDLLAVQNTYLSTFQSLGAMGLLLGTLGVALVQLRSVIERQGELALLQTMGYSKSRVGKMVLIETGYLLGLGFGVGSLSALLAITPHILAGGANLPWVALAGMLMLIAVSGLLASFVAVRAARRIPVLGTLRREF